ncbi:C45 family autoproteolytic acyltransferase/hydolase [Paraferrimonas sedimenticola]|uniref:Peptidase C45 hydrolase domain-containing protein n=1 Tax=Paraferrimonas sedimenticola TaxID=375674 RepID=A0AA37RW71_9GAMM|nr:C45 family autoproteolytic acyltransferase/hydolase [Paraferrimonas sedimenticola]GLP96104.1 hypothetical protein GCM10007895_14100 [Paraferrimonas sedimenticola]
MKKTIIAGLVSMLPLLAIAADHHPQIDPSSSMFGKSRSVVINELQKDIIPGSAFTAEYAAAMLEIKGKASILEAVKHEIQTIENAVPDFSDFKKRASKQLPVLKEFDADMYGYVASMAEGLGIAIEDFWVSLYMDAAWTEGAQGLAQALWGGDEALRNEAIQSTQSRGGCTTAAWTNGIVGGNMDFSSDFLGAQRLVKSDDLIFEGSYFGAFRSMGKYIGLIINTIALDNAASGADGLPHPIVIASVTKRARSVGEAVQMLDSLKSESPMNYTIGDNKGSAIAYNFIKTEDTRVIPATNGYVVHTNHNLKNRDKLLSVYGNDYNAAAQATLFTIARYDAASLLMSIVPKHERNVDSMKTILRTQPINMRSSNEVDFLTTNSYVMDLNKGCLYMTPDRPDLSSYEVTCFSNED